MVQVHRRYLVELMQQWTRLKEDESDFDLNFALVVDAELFRLDSLIRWLDTADGRLKRAAADASAPAAPPFPLPKARRRVGATAMSYLELRDISKVYGEGATEVHALQRIDLSVEAGSLVAVMGASGSGKSTLLTIAGSLEDPTSGEVYVGGRALSSLSRNGKARLRRQSIGYVFQDYNLLAGLSAVENVSLPLELDGVSARKAQGGWPWSRSRTSVWRIGRRTTPTSCRVASASGSPSPAPWSGAASCSWPTSPPARSTRPTPRASCA